MADKNTASIFFKSFYHEFLRLCPDAAAKFGGTRIGEEDSHKQYDKLRESILIAHRHSKGDYDIPAAFYDRFLEALINTVCGAPLSIPEAFDEQCRKSDNEKDRIGKAWKKAMEPGIEYMKKRYRTVVD